LQAGDEGVVRRAGSGSVSGRQLSSAASHRPDNAASPVALFGHHTWLRRSGHDGRAERAAMLSQRERQGVGPSDADGSDAAADQRTSPDQQTQVRVMLVSQL